MSPAAFGKKQNTLKAPPTIRPKPPNIVAHPSQKKACRPCKTPLNNGIQMDINITGNVTHRPQASASSQRFTISPGKMTTTTAPTSHTKNVHNHTSRIMPDNCRSRPVASAWAHCCANTVCNGAGRDARRHHQQRHKHRVFRGWNFLFSKCIAKLNIPAVMVAIINPAALPEERRVRLYDRPSVELVLCQRPLFLKRVSQLRPIDPMNQRAPEISFSFSSPRRRRRPG